MKKYVWLIVVIVVAAIAYGVFRARQTPGAIEIGAILPLSGDAANYGEYSKEGISLAQSDLAQKYPDLKLDIIYEDSRYSPKDGVAAYQKLTQTYTSLSAIIIGASFIAIPIKPLAEKDRVLQVAIWSSAPSYTSTHDLNFRTTLTADDTIPPILDFMKQKHLSRLAVLYANNEFGKSHDDAFVKFSPEAGISIVSSEGFGGDENDFRTQLIKIKSGKVDSVFFIGTVGQLVNALKQATDLGIKAQFISQGAAEDEELLTGASTTAEGLVYAYPFDNSSDEAKQFSRAYQTKYGRLPNQYSAEAYGGLQLMGEAIHMCQNRMDVVCWKDKLHSLQNFQTILGSGSFTASGDLKMGKVFMKTVKNGEFVKL